MHLTVTVDSFCSILIKVSLIKIGETIKLPYRQAKGSSNDC